MRNGVGKPATMRLILDLHRPAAGHGGLAGLIAASALRKPLTSLVPLRDRGTAPCRARDPPELRMGAVPLTGARGIRC
jgi:hypothetical protein